MSGTSSTSCAWGHQTINTSPIFSLGLLSLVAIIVAQMFAGVRRLHQLHQLGRLLQLRVPGGLPQLGGEQRLLGHRRVISETTLEQAAMFIWLPCRCASSTGTSYCGPNTHCNNTIGSFTCEERNCYDGIMGCQASSKIRRQGSFIHFLGN